MTGPFPATVDFLVINHRTSSSKPGCFSSGREDFRQPHLARYAAPSAARDAEDDFVDPVAPVVSFANSLLDASTREFGISTGALNTSPSKPTTDGNVLAEPVARTRFGRLDVS